MLGEEYIKAEKLYPEIRDIMLGHIDKHKEFLKKENIEVKGN